MRDLLNPKTIEKAKAKTDPYRLPDGDNLYLLIAPSGTKSWQVRDKGTTATLGKFPKVSLASARRERDKALALMRDGVNYSDHKRQVHLERRGTRADAFGEVARKWLAKTARAAGWSDVYVEQVEGILSNHLCSLDKRPVSEITLKDHIAPALERVENTSPAMWDKVKRTLDAILDHCVLKGDSPGTRYRNSSASESWRFGITPR